MECTQEWPLVEDPEGAHSYPTQLTKFNGVRSITLFFPRNFGADPTRIYYIGLRGESSKVEWEGGRGA